MRVAGATAHVRAETPRASQRDAGRKPRLGQVTESRDLEIAKSTSPLRSARFGFTPRYVFALIVRSHVPNRDYCCLWENASASTIRVSQAIVRYFAKTHAPS